MLLAVCLRAANRALFQPSNFFPCLCKRIDSRLVTRAQPSQQRFCQFGLLDLQGCDYIFQLAY